MENHYETLGVKPDATEAEIKTAFRKLARRWHPDVCKEPQAEEQFKKINRAYLILSDPSMRVRYDIALRPKSQDLPQSSTAIVEAVFSDLDEIFGAPPPKPKQKKHPKANPDLDWIPDDLDGQDDSMGGIV